jgi:hypothetical protein
MTYARFLKPQPGLDHPLTLWPGGPHSPASHVLLFGNMPPPKFARHPAGWVPALPAPGVGGAHFRGWLPSDQHRHLPCQKSRRVTAPRGSSRGLRQECSRLKLLAALARPIQTKVTSPGIGRGWLHYPLASHPPALVLSLFSHRCYSATHYRFPASLLTNAGCISPRHSTARFFTVLPLFSESRRLPYALHRPNGTVPFGGQRFAAACPRRKNRQAALTLCTLCFCGTPRVHICEQHGNSSVFAHQSSVTSTQPISPISHAYEYVLSVHHVIKDSPTATGRIASGPYQSLFLRVATRAAILSRSTRPQAPVSPN